MHAYTYLGEWEQELFVKSDRLPTHYWRYADDAWGLWEHGSEKLQEFHKLANSLHPQIKAELRFSSQQIKFLDVNIKIKDGFIQTDLISKDTDKHMYLHVTSRHPISAKTVIPYGLEIRAKRIRSEDEEYSVRRTEIKTHLRKRGYTNNMVEKQLKKVDNLDRENLIQYNTKSKIIVCRWQKPCQISMKFSKKI
jgi:predicted GNAT family acetyltransferase